MCVCVFIGKAASGGDVAVGVRPPVRWSNVFRLLSDRDVFK